MEKLSMCRICLIKNVRMNVVTNKSLLKMYGKLTDVPFVNKPIVVCFFCCARLKQCCQLQRQCVEAKVLLAQMSEDYEQKQLTNQGPLRFVGGFIITPIENISIVNDCQLRSGAIKQELPADCEEHDDVELQLPHSSEEFDPENLCNSYPDIEAHHSSESEEDRLVMAIKIEEEEEHELYENLRFKEAERAAITMKPRLKKQLEDTIAVKQTVNVLSDLKMIRSTNNRISESVAKIKEPNTTTSQINFGQSSNVTQGNRIHAGEKPFKCNICQRSFPLKQSLIIHIIRTHTGEKRYECDVCQRSFPHKRSLIYHIRTHTGEKPHKCDICQRSFAIKGNLNRHRRLHSVERPFKCDVCLRSYIDKCALTRHSLIHTSEQPYKCDICQRSFGFKGNLKRHSRIHTDENPLNEI